METQTKQQTEVNQLREKFLKQGTLNKEDIVRWSELDELLEVPGSLADDKNKTKEN